MKNKEPAKLFQLVPELTLFSHYSLGKVSTKDGDNMPHMVWPDRSPCLLANLYMLSLRVRRGRSGRQGLSRRGSKGGTMGEYAQKLSQLIRFCYNNNWDFINLSDDKFTSFINSLRNEKSGINPEIRKKTETTVIAVGRICLDFLCFVGEFHGDPNFVSANGTILASQQSVSITYDNRSEKISRSYWNHHSFSGGERRKKRNPIPAVNIEKLRAAVDEAGGSRFLQSRRHCTLSILEQVGARRGEVAQIKVFDVMNASKMEYPMLRIITLKRESDSYRSVPVSHMLLADLKKHIRIYRNKIVKRKIGKANEHDYFFISETTGKPLKEDTITSEISFLRSTANIEEQACAHMFRHTYITNLLVLLIRRHDFEHPGDFRQALISSEKFKTEIMQWTGHRSASSLETYIDFAFAKVKSYAETVSSVDLIRAQELFDKMSLQLLERLKNGRITVDEYSYQYLKLVDLKSKDFEAAQTRER